MRSVFMALGLLALMSSVSAKKPVLTVPVDICSLPKVVGPCRGSFERYFFNSETGTCESFIYGGCVGNDNNFPTETDCQRECVKEICALPQDTGPCEAFVPRFFYNQKSTKCEEFQYGGCEGNANNFATIHDCGNKCVCSQEKVTGMCKGYFPRYYYNSETQTCEEFIYGGCGGNGNNFETLEECQGVCVPTCSLPKSPGKCKGSFQKYYFDAKAGKCQFFVYGGCGGNRNRFDSMEECADTCICKSPSDRGPCKAYLIRYYYNATTGRCEKFTYGGCPGNANNFQSVEECENICLTK